MDVYYSESIDDGLTFSADVDVTPLQYDQVGPIIDVDNDGNVYLAWKGYNQSGGSDVYFNSSLGAQDTTPATPSNLSATAISEVQINLTWQDNSDNEVGFYLERRKLGEGFQRIATIPTNETSYNDNGLEAGTTYIYRIQAYNDIGPSVYSNEASATTKPPQKADFTWSPETPKEGEEVQFTDLSEPQEGITSWSWNFGDGGTSSEQPSFLGKTRLLYEEKPQWNYYLLENSPTAAQNGF